MALEIARVQALCFDVDGTLCDTDDQYVDRLTGYLHLVRYILPKRDPKVMARRLIMAIEDPGNLVLDMADRWRIDGLTTRLLQVFKHLKPRASIPAPAISGVSEMLMLLHLRYPLAIVSTRDEDVILEFLQNHALTDFFQVIVTGQTCQRTKPHPMPVIWAARQMDVPPENCLMIGDTKVDIRAGRAAGTQTVGVLCGFGTESELTKAGANLILKSTADLASYLLEPNPNL